MHAVCKYVHQLTVCRACGIVTRMRHCNSWQPSRAAALKLKFHHGSGVTTVITCAVTVNIRRSTCSNRALLQAGSTSCSSTKLPREYLQNACIQANFKFEASDESKHPVRSLGKGNTSDCVFVTSAARVATIVNSMCIEYAAAVCQSRSACAQTHTLWHTL